MSGVEINLQSLGDDSVPGLRVEVGLDELREALATAGEHGVPVMLHFGAGGDGRPDELHGLVAQVGAGVLMMDVFGDDENERVLVPLDRVVWVRVKRPA
jgi:hypothetical protein